MTGIGKPVRPLRFLIAGLFVAVALHIALRLGWWTTGAVLGDTLAVIGVDAVLIIHTYAALRWLRTQPITGHVHHADDEDTVTRFACEPRRGGGFVAVDESGAVLRAPRSVRACLQGRRGFRQIRVTFIADDTDEVIEQVWVTT